MPTEQRDIITITPGSEVWGLGGPDEFTWPGGSATIHGGDTIQGFEIIDRLDLGGRDYLATDTRAGLLLTAGADSVLLGGVHDFEV